MMKYELFRKATSLDEFKKLVLMNRHYSRFSHMTALQEFLVELRDEMRNEQYVFIAAVSDMIATDSTYREKNALTYRVNRKMEAYYAECLSEFPEYANCEDEIEEVAA